MSAASLAPTRAAASVQLEGARDALKTVSRLDSALQGPAIQLRDLVHILLVEMEEQLFVDAPGFVDAFVGAEFGFSILRLIHELVDSRCVRHVHALVNHGHLASALHPSSCTITFGFAVVWTVKAFPEFGNVT